MNTHDDDDRRQCSTCRAIRHEDEFPAPGENTCAACYITCRTCNTTKHPTFFYNNAGTTNRKEGSCTDCKRKNAERRARERRANEAGRVPDTKVCPRCEEDLPASAYDRRADRGTLESHCRTCKRQKPHTPRVNVDAVEDTTPVDRVKRRGAATRARVCAHCKEKKGPEHFYVRRGGSTLSSWCRPCTRERAAESKAART